MSFVLDASIALALVLADERSEGAQELIAGSVVNPPWVPTLWEYEILSGLRNAEARGRITQGDGDLALALLQRLPLRVERPPAVRVLEVARQADVSTYDASYLALAASRNLPLATLDVRLGRAAAALDVPLLTW